MQRDDCAARSMFRAFLRACGAPAAVLLTAAPAFAQGTTIVQTHRTPYLELLVTAVLCGAAVFAVCRSSRRN